jgi:hypothetical protein
MAIPQQINQDSRRNTSRRNIRPDKQSARTFMVNAGEPLRV